MGLTQTQIEIFAENRVWANYLIILATATLLNIRVCIYSAFIGGELIPKRWLEFVEWREWPWASKHLEEFNFITR